MPECQHCGSHVSQQYVKVFAVDEEEGVQVCPNCPDKIRAHGEIREARSSRERSSEPTKYDPTKA